MFLLMANSQKSHYKGHESNSCFCVLETGRISRVLLLLLLCLYFVFIEHPLESMLSCFLHLIDIIRFI